MLTAPAQASTLFGSERSMCRRGGGLQRRAWSQEAWLFNGGVAKPARGRGQAGFSGRPAPALAQSRAVVRPRCAEPLGALRSAAVLGSPSPARSRPRNSATMSKLAQLGREEIMECQVMWEPDSKKDTQMDRFRAAVGAACGLALGECGARG